MAVRTVFNNEDKLFYITFTCYEWYPLIELTDSYDLFYRWFEMLKSQGVEVMGYVIMPNHMHCILNFPDNGLSLNSVIKEAKVFLARAILKRLTAAGQWEMLQRLKAGVTESRKAKGQNYIVFQRGFDAKAIVSKKFLQQKLRYIHLNPVRGNYNLVGDWRDYEHSSAGFYEYADPGHFSPVHYDDLG